MANAQLRLFIATASGQGNEPLRRPWQEIGPVPSPRHGPVEARWAPARLRALYKIRGCRSLWTPPNPKINNIVGLRKKVQHKDQDIWGNVNVIPQKHDFLKCKEDHGFSQKARLNTIINQSGIKSYVVVSNPTFIYSKVQNMKFHFFELTKSTPCWHCPAPPYPITSTCLSFFGV